MNDDQLVGFVFLIPTLVIVLWLWITRPRTPRYDARIPARQRRVTRNAFKSRAGIR
jgi:hypothetical protein